ncbi:hypothetical protein B4U80_01856 [Leptotrombidium deliense]|uniref:Uncharacterized protein n=1 Tax=Leptotrombidium deliense TaxID=299467 RepID=A0A443QHX1_9ACAR|nr:hypothetical protein B4U80_01856 [Leptotrombidium deliense]
MNNPRDFEQVQETLE